MRQKSAPKRIHLYDLGRMEPRKDVGIKGQCCKRYFHGKDNEVEDSLSELEDTLARTLQRIAKTRKLPQRRSKAYRDMLTFAVLQNLRTQKRMAELRRLLEKSLERTFKDIGELPEGIVLDHLELITLSLSMIPDALELRWTRLVGQN